MSDFIKVEKYQCVWCGGLFATMKHDCKFNPKKKNCLSCIHCIGVEKSECQIDYYICDFNDEAGDTCSEFRDLASNEWKGFCTHYETAPDYKGKKSFLQMMKRWKI